MIENKYYLANYIHFCRVNGVVSVRGQRERTKRATVIN